MNKKIKTYFESLGLSIQGNNAYGTIRGYEVSANVAMLDTVSPIKIHVNFYMPIQVKVQMASEIRALAYKHFVIDLDMYGVSLGFNDPLTVGKLLNRMPDMMNNIFNAFDKYEAKGIGYCPICGDVLQENSKQYSLDWALVTMDNSCVANINRSIVNENNSFASAPNNYLKGTLGALLGACVGVVAFVILFFIGYISALTSFIAIILGAFLYKKFGGKQDKVMVLIVSLVSVLSMVLTIFGIYVLASQGLASEFGFHSSGFQAFKDMMTIAEFSKEFKTNLLMTILYTFIGVAYEAYSLNKSVKRQGEIK